MSVNRPWGSLGIGWLICLLVLIVAVLSLLVTINVANLAIWLIIALAIAGLVG